MDTTGFKRVLIIKPSSLGDVIHALPVASALKAGLPDARIDWVVGKGYEEILKGNPAISRVITFDRGLLGGSGRLRRLTGFVSELRLERYDLVIDLQGLLRSGLMAFACRSKRRIGFANAREGAIWFYTDKVAVPETPLHAVDRYMLILKWLGLKAEGGVEFTLEIAPEDSRQADGLLKEMGIRDGETFVAIAPSARWETKRWPAGNFVRLSDMLLKEKGIRSVFVGTADDARLMDGGGIREDSIAFGRTSLKGLAALLKRASLLVTNDSGPMHIAAAVGTPAVAVFGPTDPVRTGPYGAAHKVVTAGVECAPCFKKECESVKCLTGVTVEQVYNAVEGLLRRNICP